MAGPVSAGTAPSRPGALNPASAVGSPAERIDLPYTDAQHRDHSKPAYPALSKRLGEQGRVVVNVLIGPDGTAQRVELLQSSGFDRLDQSALATALRWRYVPGKKGGVPQTMWFGVPITFVIE